MGVKNSSRLGIVRVIDSTVHAFCPRRLGGYLESMKVVTAKSWRNLEKELVLEGTFKKRGDMDIREEIKERGRLEGRFEGWQKGQQEGRNSLTITEKAIIINSTRLINELRVSIMLKLIMKHTQNKLRRILIFLNKKEVIMKRIPVESSNLKSIGYDKDVLEVEFKSGGIYQYLNVPEHEYKSLMSAESHGKYLNANIKPNYQYQKIS